MSIWTQLAAASLLLAGSAAIADEAIVIGLVYDIAEPDALAEIKARAEITDWQQAMSKPRADWSAYRFAPVKAALQTHTREHVPYHTVEQAVVTASGEILYPAGFQFNPLDYVTLPRRVVVIRPEHGQWALENLQKTDLLLLAGSDNEHISKALGRPVFLLDHRTRQRLGVEVAPSVIEQRGSVFVIDEYYVESPDGVD